MNNTVYLIGRIAKLETYENYGMFTLAVRQEIKNKNGEYDTDFINCKCFSWTLDYMKNYCNVGDLLAVRGRLSVSTYENKTTYSVMVEKVSLLENKKTTSKDTKVFPDTTSVKQEDICINDDDLPF